MPSKDRVCARDDDPANDFVIWTPSARPKLILTKSEQEHKAKWRNHERPAQMFVQESGAGDRVDALLDL